jgi:hypothetical protein
MIESIPRHVAQIRSYFGTSDADMLKIVLNSTSHAEASFAIEVLRDRIPEKSLVTACNLREALKELPRCPITMAVDFEQLARIWELSRVDNCWERSFSDPGGDYDVILIGEGNAVWDLAVRTEASTVLWLALDPDEDVISTGAIDLVMSRETLLRNIVDLVHDTGLSFNPNFYFSLEDWRLEYAGGIFDELNDLLPRPIPPEERGLKEHHPRFRMRDVFDL